jgi:hypothetical protein
LQVDHRRHSAIRARKPATGNRQLVTGNRKPETGNQRQFFGRSGIVNFKVKLIAMPKFVIERDMPGIGNITQKEMQEAAEKSCGVLMNMGPQIQWIHSYITDNKIYCVYQAPDEASVKQHAEQSGFPATKISRVRAIMDPSTAEV